MKNKLRVIFLSLVMVFAVTTLSACKKKKQEPEDTRQQPTVNAIVENREFYVGDKLEDISLTLSEGDTAGVIAWNVPETELVLGGNECEWTFTPTDADAYFSKTGKSTLMAVIPKDDPTVSVSLASSAYAEAKLQSVVIVLDSGSTAGSVEWIEPNTKILEGEHEYIWKFIPTDSATYKEVTGKIKVTGRAQTLETISVKTNPTKTQYVAFEQFETAGLVINLNYNAGKVVEIVEGYSVEYISGTNFVAGNSYVTIKYAGKSCRVNVSVSKIEVARPVVEGTYVYSEIEGVAKVHTAKLSTTPNANLYTVTNNTQSVAGSHNVTVTLKDSANYKWTNSNAAAIQIPFVIQKADRTLQKNDYVGTFDGIAHGATAVSGTHPVYYSLNSLNETNYNTAGSTTPIEFMNSVDVKVYFFIAGDSNYKDISDYLTVKINKANVVVSTNYCYSVVAGKPVGVPESYVSVVGINSSSLAVVGKIEFTYYTSFTNETTNTKTTSADGATKDGGMPSKVGKYVVVSKYLGTENYNTGIAVSEFLIDEDNSALLAHGSDRLFAWKTVDPNPSIDTSDVYFEVSKQENGTIIELVVDIRIVDTEYVGKAIKVGDTYQIIVNNTTYDLEFSADTIAMKLGNGEVFKTVTKWEIPNYLGTFECDLAPDDDGVEVSRMVIYNDFGVVRFTYVGNYKKSNGEISTITREGTVKYVELSSTLTFNYVKDDSTTVFIRISGVSDSTVLETLTIGSSAQPAGIRGDYVRV